MRLFYRICRAGTQFFFLLLCRGRVLHLTRVPKEGGVLLVCNHQSFFDPMIATNALPRECHYMARDTLFRNNWFEKLIRAVNTFPVKRGTGDVGAIKETLRRLKRGALVTVFPEGTRTHDGGIGRMQPGVVMLARKAGVPLATALILGAYEIWPRQAKWPRLGPVLVEYGEPLSPEQIRDMTDEECISALRDQLVAMMAKRRSHPMLRGRLKPLPNEPKPAPLSEKD